MPHDEHLCFTATVMTCRARSIPVTGKAGKRCRSEQARRVAPGHLKCARHVIGCPWCRQPSRTGIEVAHLKAASEATI
ncbi:hypothetical protein HaLaN_32325 [Haematococcus lacustris]|uniref:Uncharacterized protein n=1 Tax=Haematococcus lacustris TaxID=44745 RepID=A0A6A0AKK3_HAELA|nr:hypothetical protein HaLaN_32325 [Haematococcus lacustris]